MMRHFSLLSILAVMLTACPASSVTSQKSAPPATGGSYTPPTDVCALADPSLLGPEAGKPDKGTPETETPGVPDKDKPDLSLTGCVFNLQADSNNTLKLFVAVDGNTLARYEQFGKVWTELNIPGFVTEPVSGLGAKAIYVVRQTAQGLRIEGFLSMYDGNLYIEARFMGGGTKEWNPATVRDGLIKIARHAMSKVPKK